VSDASRAELLLIHGIVVAQDNESGPYLLLDGAVAIADGLIVDVDKTDRILASYAADDVIDADGGVIMPGLVNGHVHTMQTFARGLCDLDHPDRRSTAAAGDPMGNAAVWAQNAWLVDAGLTDEEAAACARLAIAEMLLSGTTTYADVCAFNVDALAEVVGESGIRAVLAKNASDIRDLDMPLPDQMVRPAKAEVEDSVAFYGRWNGAFHGRLTAWMGLHALWACSDELSAEMASEAQRLRTGLSMHLTQTPGEVPYAIEHRGGVRPVAHAEELGLFGGRFVAIHSAYLDEADIEAYARHDVSVVHCPVAAMK